MRKNAIAVLMAFFLVFASAAVFAATDYETSGGAARTDHIVKADDLTGKMVQDKNGNDIGEISNVLLDTSSGASYALISLNNKLHPVPLSAFKKVQEKYTLNIDKARLAQSPGFSEEEMNRQMANRSFDTSVYKFFGVTPPWGSKQMKH